jgi:nicotinamide-nucleotide adenylyltransferase
MKALFIGRFQPFHNGHLNLLKMISKEYSKIIIGIGSSQYGNLKDNPFTSEERISMIKNTLEKKNIYNFKIVLIPDINDPPVWVDHVLSIISDFDVVVTNNSFTRKLFVDKGYVVKTTPIFNKEKYSGKEIRKRIYKNEIWKDLIPEDVLRIIEKNDGVKRIKLLFTK